MLRDKQSRSPHDLYKQVLRLKFDNPQVHFVQNDDFVDPMATLGGVIHGRIQQFVLLYYFFHQNDLIFVLGMRFVESHIFINLTAYLSSYGDR